MKEPKVAVLLQEDKGRVERITYAPGHVEYALYLLDGAHLAEAARMMNYIPTVLGEKSVRLVDVIHDDGLTGLIYGTGGE